MTSRPRSQAKRLSPQKKGATRSAAQRARRARTVKARGRA
jgi:hypothetical protein